MSKLIKDKQGNQFWLNEFMEYDREDGPAIEYQNGDKQWYRNGILHRIGGPAFDYFDGRKEWFENGLRHRVDGPAVEHWFGENFYWFRGEHYSEIKNDKEWKRIIRLMILK